MLTRLRIKSFKSIVDQEVKLPRLTVLFGPNAAGKSNFIDALQCLSRIVTERTLKDALAEPIRGYPIEFFRFPKGGMKKLFEVEEAFFEFEADLEQTASFDENKFQALRYRAEVGIKPKTARLFLADEYLTRLNKIYIPKDTAKIERDGDNFLIRAIGRPSRPKMEKVGQGFTNVSIPSYTGYNYPDFDNLRREMGEWRTYYLDPRISMRKASPPIQISDIGALGEYLAPYLFRLKNEQPKYFSAIQRTLRTIIPSIASLDVRLDETRGEINIQITQDNIAYSTRVISEGTLRILALCAISLNPWGSSLIAFEEPENGVHPRRLELITDLLTSLAIDGKKQLIITTHSPKFCQQIIEKKRVYKDDISMKVVKKKGNATVFEDFDPETLLENEEIREAFTSKSEDGIIEEMIMRGFVDG
ncbi:MAG: AAA family ATPase [candidate division Zixibacteria bacterium]|nr:AAA family ATPase [Candidatus Tariuqbacter arcticus]